MKSVEQRLEAIENRNAKVEQDKAWETSWTRRISIATLTYLVVLFYLTIVVKAERAYIHALVPVIGYLLSTLAISAIRDIWSSSRQ